MVTAELRGLTVRIDTGRWSETVLDGVDLVVPEGQIIALLGESGCGKSMVAAALAAALLPSPGVLVADEPAGSLDTETAYGVWTTLRRYADSGAAVLVITHDVPMLTATRVADQLVIMRDGRVAEAGGTTEMAAHTDPYVRGFFQPDRW